MRGSGGRHAAGRRASGAGASGSFASPAGGDAGLEAGAPGRAGGRGEAAATPRLFAPEVEWTAWWMEELTFPCRPQFISRTRGNER